MTDKWDNTPRPKDTRTVIPIEELRAKREAKDFLKGLFPNMNPDTADMMAGVLAITMAPPTKKEKP